MTLVPLTNLADGKKKWSLEKEVRLEPLGICGSQVDFKGFYIKNSLCVKNWKKHKSGPTLKKDDF